MIKELLQPLWSIGGRKDLCLRVGQDFHQHREQFRIVIDDQNTSILHGTPSIASKLVSIDPSVRVALLHP
jgi:hypothetical protein